MYSPTLGRFIQNDPIGFDAGDMNLQRYVGNNPAKRLDPTGLVELTVDLATKTATLEVGIRFTFENGREAGQWTPQREKIYAAKFINEIETHWSGNPYTLIGGPRKGLLSTITFDSSPIPICARLKPRLKLSTSPGNDLRIHVISGSVPQGGILARKSWGVFSGDYIQVYENDSLTPAEYVVNGKKYQQITANHEFGHFLGLEHPGQDGFPWQRERKDSGDDYAKDAGALMGVGMEWRPSYMRKWVELLGWKNTPKEIAGYIWRVE